MRVIAGSLGGRQFDSPTGHRTHPMAEKVRGGLFNALGDIEGLTVLDAFAGSGALSIEAISRGADQVVAIEVDKKAHQTIRENAKQLSIDDKIKAIRANFTGWSANNPDQLFDLVIADPPYDDFRQDLIVKLTNHVKPSGLLVISKPPDIVLELQPTTYKLQTKFYGDSQLVFYRKTG